jgi:2-hydroxy-3-keto-5-methylthiopentenyl-1-phosphate phosphatase
MYDFDKTLCTNDMQNYSFIPSLGIGVDEFWDEVNKITNREKMDGLLCYMYQMLKKAEYANIPIRREDFVKLGEKIEYYPGVEEWFDRINAYGEALGVQVEHYVISSGLNEIIEGSKIYKNFKKTYACEFLYDVNGVAVWAKNVVNFTTKTQFLFRINKGVLELSEDKELNTYIPMEERRVPFRNMIYIGDGLSDVPCMKMMKAYGGYSIAVYQNKDAKVEALLNRNRVDYIYPADYRENQGLDITVKNIIRKMAISEILYNENARQKLS